MDGIASGGRVCSGQMRRVPAPFVCVCVWGASLQPMLLEISILDPKMETIFGGKFPVTFRVKLAVSGVLVPPLC